MPLFIQLTVLWSFPLPLQYLSSPASSFPTGSFHFILLFSLLFFIKKWILYRFHICICVLVLLPTYLADPRTCNVWVDSTLSMLQSMPVSKIIVIVTFHYLLHKDEAKMKTFSEYPSTPPKPQETYKIKTINRERWVIFVRVTNLFLRLIYLFIGIQIIQIMLNNAIIYKMTQLKTWAATFQE